MEDARYTQTIYQLQRYAEKNDFNAFAVPTGSGNEHWQNDVFFIKCEVNDNESLAHALAPKPEVTTYLRMSHPCS